jgi:hypothetical protein
VPGDAKAMKCRSQFGFLGPCRSVYSRRRVQRSLRHRGNPKSDHPAPRKISFVSLARLFTFY